MRVEKPHPEISGNSFYPLQQPGQSRATRGINGLAGSGFLLPKIHAIIGGILADQVNLLNTFLDKVTNLGFDRLNWPASMPAPHLRNHAETAGMVAPFSDF